MADERQDKKDKKLAEEQLRRYNDLESKRRAIFDPAWQQLSDYFLPSLSDVNTEKTEGTTGWTDRIFDTTAIQANQILAAGQRNWLTPSNEPWFAFEPPEEIKHDDDDDAAIWLGRAADILLKELSRSNFYAKVHEDYLSVGTFGTGCLIAEEGKRTALNFHQLKIATYVADEDDEGVVDTLIREIELTVRQAEQRYGENMLPPRMRRMLRSGKGLDTKQKFIHSIFPRMDSMILSGPRAGSGKPVASVTIAKDDQWICRNSGYDEMPAMVSRYSKWGTDSVWGFSPAFLCLPEARQLNFVTQYVDALAELKAYPRLLIPEELVDDVDLRAGGQTVWRPQAGGGSAKPEEWATAGDYNVAKDLLARKTDAINRAFYVNLFTMLEQLADKKMTAYEIAQRVGEKLEQFTPTFDRRVTEFLNPLLKRCFGILFRQGRFGQPPASLYVPHDGGKSFRLAMPEIVITSRISLALRALRNQAKVQFLQIILPIAQQKPEVLDNFNWDKFTRDLALDAGMESEVFLPLKQVLAIRNQRFQMQKAQATMELAQGAAKAGKDLAKAPEDLRDQAVGQLQEQFGT